MANQVITLTLPTDNEWVAKNLKAGHDAYYEHESVINGSTVTCEHDHPTDMETPSLYKFNIG